MKKIIYLFLSILLLSTAFADDCLNDGTSPDSSLKETNFEDLQTLSMNIKNKLGGPQKGFYIEFKNNCQYEVNFALALASWGRNDNVLAKVYYEPLFVQGWWNARSGSRQRIFFERKVTETFAFYAQASNGLYWGRKQTLYTVPGPSGGKVYPFIEYKSEDKCEADANNVVTCFISVSCE